MKGLSKKPNLSNLIFTIITALMVFIMLITSSYAWFALRDKVDLSFTANSGDVMLYTAIYQGESGEGSYVWDDGINLEQTDVIFGSEYTSPNYATHLGTVDNLSFRSESNNLWYCLKIKKASGVNFSSLRLSYDDTTPYKLFALDANGENPTQVTDDAVALGAINGSLDTLINIDSLIISTATPETFFLAEESNIPDVNENDTDAKSVVKYSQAGAESFSGTITLDIESNEYYYLYFRAYAVLESFAEVAEEISAYMPCIIQFNLSITLIVDNVQP